mgnify:CR=1 FL=1
MKVIQSDYINKHESPSESCDECFDWFDLNELDQVFVVQTEEDELLVFCDDYTCYHNYTN